MCRLRTTRVHNCSSLCLSELDAEPVHGTLYEKDKVLYQSPCEQDPSNKQEEVGCDLATAIMDS